MRRSARGFVLTCALALMACAAPAAQATGRYRLVAYVAGWETLSRIDARKLTAINYAFAHIDKDGRIILDQPRADDFLARMRELKSANPELKILVSVGGWGADGFSDAAESESSRAKFAESAADLIAHNVLDGVDLDWEYPGLPGPGIRHRDEDKHNFTLLLQTLRGKLDALAHERRHRADEHYLLTAALADSEFVAHIELDRIHAYLDWIDLMTYDFHNSLTPTTGHHAALSRSATSAAGERSVARAVGQYLAAGVPARKLIVGVPFYGRACAGVHADNHGLDQAYTRYDADYPWSRLVADFIGRNGYVRYWDATANAPYLWNAQSSVFISYDDPKSLAIKARFVKSHGLGGIMYWEQSQDLDGQLLEALSAALQ